MSSQYKTIELSNWSAFITSEHWPLLMDFLDDKSRYYGEQVFILLREGKAEEAKEALAKRDAIDGIKISVRIKVDTLRNEIEKGV